MIPIRFDPQDRDRGVGTVFVREGYGAVTGDIIWVRPSALEMLDELGIRYQRVNGDTRNASKKSNRKKEPIASR